MRESTRRQCGGLRCRSISKLSANDRDRLPPPARRDRTKAAADVVRGVRALAPLAIFRKIERLGEGALR